LGLDEIVHNYDYEIQESSSDEFLAFIKNQARSRPVRQRLWWTLWLFSVSRPRVRVEGKYIKERLIGMISEAIEGCNSGINGIYELWGEQFDLFSNTLQRNVLDIENDLNRTLDKKSGTEDRIIQLQILEEKLNGLKDHLFSLYFADCDHKWKPTCSFCLSKKLKINTTAPPTPSSLSSSSSMTNTFSFSTPITTTEIEHKCIDDITACESCGLKKPGVESLVASILPQVKNGNTDIGPTSEENSIEI